MRDAGCGVTRSRVALLPNHNRLDSSVIVKRPARWQPPKTPTGDGWSFVLSRACWRSSAV